MGSLVLKMISFASQDFPTLVASVSTSSYLKPLSRAPHCPIVPDAVPSLPLIHRSLSGTVPFLLHLLL